MPTQVPRVGHDAGVCHRNVRCWSAEGDSNAGRGSKTTVIYTPPKRSYEQGNGYCSEAVARLRRARAEAGLDQASRRAMR
ncbi:filamentous haemagglutinin family protein [Bradyrhizobium sp. RDI18]|uniref:filamentous haemagglutinin family protein n=1 Tax=Bradyrhizobium sp. RDI18 TaxID=3367400 RepID=UPI00371E5283